MWPSSSATKRFPPKATRPLTLLHQTFGLQYESLDQPQSTASNRSLCTCTRGTVFRAPLGIWGRPYVSGARERDLPSSLPATPPATAVGKGGNSPTWASNQLVGVANNELRPEFLSQLQTPPFEFAASYCSHRQAGLEGQLGNSAILGTAGPLRSPQRCRARQGLPVGQSSLRRRGRHVLKEGLQQPMAHPLVSLHVDGRPLKASS